jgi:hypothetical protein
MMIDPSKTSNCHCYSLTPDEYLKFEPEKLVGKLGLLMGTKDVSTGGPSMAGEYKLLVVV